MQLLHNFIETLAVISLIALLEYLVVLMCFARYNVLVKYSSERGLLYIPVLYV